MVYAKTTLRGEAVQYNRRSPPRPTKARRRATNASVVHLKDNAQLHGLAARVAAELPAVGSVFNVRVHDAPLADNAAVARASEQHGHYQPSGTGLGCHAHLEGTCPDTP